MDNIRKTYLVLKDLLDEVGTSIQTLEDTGVKYNSVKYARKNLQSIKVNAQDLRNLLMEAFKKSKES